MKANIQSMKIGVFDSGVGGLTVLRALLPRIANAEYLYLGDTARLPYGSKSQATIARYAVSSSQFLIDQGCEFLVIACNTASALALDEIRQTAEPHGVPVVGVIGPGAAAAAAESATRDALVIATSATVQSHAYAAACKLHGLRSLEKACPLARSARRRRLDRPSGHRRGRRAFTSPSSIDRPPKPASIPTRSFSAAPTIRCSAKSSKPQSANSGPASPPQVIDSAEATASEVERQAAHIPGRRECSTPQCPTADQLLRHRLGNKISPARHALPRPADR